MQIRLEKILTVIMAMILIPASAYAASNQILIYREDSEQIDFSRAGGRGVYSQPGTASAMGSYCESEGCPAGMCYIAPGRFMMGSPYSGKVTKGDEAFHKVAITNGFCIGKYEVTQREWERVMGGNPSFNKSCGPNCPVEMVSWLNAQKFIQKYNKLKGGGYRLPTEAEWEYSARSGMARGSYTGNAAMSEQRRSIDWSEDHEQCWTRDCKGAIHPAGHSTPNFWGLYDMLGNVEEWTSDWYGEYPTERVDNPTGPGNGYYRVARGLCWNTSIPELCRADTRDWLAPQKRSKFIGFRLVRSFPVKKAKHK